MAKTGLAEWFFAWWHGIDLDAAPRSIAEVSRAEEENLESELGKPNCKIWTPPRMALTQTMFGEGMASPGGDKAIAKLAFGLQLDKSKTLVEYGAMLGGVGLAIAARTGCRVIGLEADDSLAKAANILSFRRNLQNRAATRHVGDGFGQFKPGSIDAIIAKEQFFSLPQKAALFGQIGRVLKPGGQLVFTDIVLGQAPPGESVRKWIAQESRVPRPVRVQDIQVLMNAAGLELERSEDITEEYRAALVEAFDAYAAKVDNGTIPLKWKAWVLAEGRYWQSRLDSIAEGAISVQRFSAKRSTEMRIKDFFTK